MQYAYALPPRTAIISYCLFQSNYHECALLILLKHPTQLDMLLTLVFSQTLEEDKVRGLMEQISKNNTELLFQIMSRLARSTCSTGMELLRCVLNVS